MLMRTEKTPEESIETSPAAVAGFATSVSFVFLLLLSALAVYLCWLMTEPFLPVLTWAVALAVVAHPLHAALEKHIRRPNLAALLAVVLVTAVLIVPGTFLIDRAVREGAAGLRTASLFQLG